MIERIETVPALSDNYMYALVGSEGRCALVDPSEAAPALAFLRAHHLQLDYVLCTHHHWDHIGGISELRKVFPALEVLTSTSDLPRIEGSTRALDAKETHVLFGEDSRVIEIPGHTLGQVAFWLPRLHALFVGDTLFSCGCGRMFEGTYPQYFASLQKIKILPPDTEIYFGHEYTLRNIEFAQAHGADSAELRDFKDGCEKTRARGEFTTPVLLKRELAINPFLMANTVTDFQKWRELRNAW